MTSGSKVLVPVGGKVAAGRKVLVPQGGKVLVPVGGCSCRW